MAKMEMHKLEKAKRTHRMTVTDANKTLGDSLRKIGAKGIDLGEGYVLVKIRGPERPAPLARRENVAPAPQQLPGVPVVSNAELHNLIQRYHRTHAAAHEASKVPQENQLFLDQFARQEMQRYAELEHKGELVSSHALAKAMAVTRQAISKAVKERRMFALAGVAGKMLYPAFYADPALNRSQMGKVSKELGQLPASSKWQFFTNPRVSLNGASPINALRKGKFAEVIAAAAAFREA